MIGLRFARVRWRLPRADTAGAQLAGGALALLVASGLFGWIAGSLADGDPLTVLDAYLADWFHDRATPWLTQWMLGISALHDTIGIGILSVLLAFCFIRLRHWDWLLGLALAVPGGVVLNVLVKHVFERQRPAFTDPIVELTTYSFPSGHTLAATVFYGTLAAFLLPRAATVAARAAILVAAIALVALVALSRLYLGAHYLSDVTAAVAEGVAWLALCLMALATLRWRRGATATVS